MYAACSVGIDRLKERQLRCAITTGLPLSQAADSCLDCNLAAKLVTITHLRAISTLDLPSALICLIRSLTSSSHPPTTSPFASFLSLINGATSSPVNRTLSPPSHLKRGGIVPVVWLGAVGGGE